MHFNIVRYGVFCNLALGSEHLSQYVTSHPGQLSLAIPLWVGAMSTGTSQTAVTPCGWGVKAVMVRSSLWVAGKTA